ncbi:MAG: hypothetical protein Kow00105_19700 [Phycisphaeraceae bacterium]
MSSYTKDIGRLGVLAVCVLLLACNGAHGQTLGGLMSHVNIGVTAGQVLVFKDDPALIPTMIGPDRFDPPFSVLNGKGYNAQFGWTALFPFDLQGDLIWIEVLDQSDGLLTFQGGYATDTGGTGVPDPGDQAMVPIFGTFGSPTIWSWSGTMTHNWYAASVPGSYYATYRVYVGDPNGIANPAYTSAEVTFEFFNPVALLVGDLNTDGYVGIADLNLVLGQWNQSVTHGDPLSGEVTGDGYVGIEDLNAVLGHWNTGTLPPSHAMSVIPEPAAVISLSMMVLIGRRDHGR